ncbi:MAG: hypothetical protein QM751_12510 [Paludibacteraceae bacterium]
MIGKKILYSLLIFCVSLPVLGAGKVIKISETEIEKYRNDMTPYIYNLITSLENSKGNFKLIFPKGTYHFRPTEAFGKYHEITNHDNGYRYFAFPLIGMKDIEIDGGGSDFMFHGKIIPFLAEKSTNIKISNLNIDWEVPFYLEGSIISFQ